MLKAGAGAATAGTLLAADGSLDPQLDPVGEADAAIGTAAVIGLGAAAGTYGGVSWGLVAGTVIDGFDDALEASIEKSILIAHDAAVSEMESYGQVETLMENALEDTNTMAHQEARHAIASTWESGGSAGDAYQDAISEIESYYAARIENNWIQATAKSVTQQAYVFQAAIESAVDGGGERDINDEDAGGWAFGTVDHPDHGTCSWSELLEQRQEVELELFDGETTTVELPDVLLEWDGEGLSYEVNLKTILDGYDDSEEEYVFDLPNGDEVTWGGTLGVPSWSYETDDGEDETLRSYDVLDFPEQFEAIREQIEGQAATVIDNYDQGLAEDLFEKLDDGEISPSDIRGIDATARFLAGTEDASADSYQLALLQQLGMSQGDMTEIASMTAEYSGWEGVRVRRDDDGDRQIYVDRKVEDAEYSGQLFAREIPDGGLNVDGTYLVDPILYFGDHDYKVYAIDATVGSELWSYDGHSDYLKSVAVGPEGETVYSGSQAEEIHAIDATDGSQLWTYDGHSNTISNVAVGLDGETVYSTSYDEELHAIDASDGSQLWSYDGHSDSVLGVAVGPDGERVYSASYDQEVHAIDTSDGSQLWSYDGHSDSVSDLGVSPDGGTVYSGSDAEEIHAIDTSDGSELWSETTPGEVVALAVAPDGSEVYYTAGMDELHAIDTSDGSDLRSYDDYGNPEDISIGPAGDVLYVGSDDYKLHAIDADGGGELWSNDPDAQVDGISVTYNAAVRPDLEVGGSISGARYFDAVDSEEVDLRNGILTMTAMSDQDGDEIEETSSDDWGSPEYDQIDLDPWVEYLEDAESIRTTVEDYLDETSSPGGGGGLLPSGLGLPDLPLVQWALLGLGALAGINLLTR